MCYRCWKKYGLPEIDNERVRLAARLADQVCDIHSAGGCLHILLDDWNIEAYFLREAETYWQENRADCDPVQHEVERLCLEAFRGIKQKERASALALHDGYWKPKESA